MTKWVCTPCDYVYDPEVGDPANGIPPGTPWEDVPDDWLCPDCSLGKEFFEAVEEE
jgi:rubredoxin